MDNFDKWNKSKKMRPYVGSVGGKEAKVILSQIRVVDAKRLLRKIDVLNRDIFEDIRKKVKEIL